MNIFKKKCCLYSFIKKFINTNKNNLLTTKQTQVVIEGFPRSANTYAVLAFQKANPDIRIAHHLHVPAQLDCALQYDIPTLILIRNPEDAIKSMLVRERTYTLERAIDEYISFYELVLKNKEKIFIADFKNIISNFDLIMQNFNKKYNTSFNIFDNSQQANDEIKKQISLLSMTSDKKAGETGMAMPSETKEKLKNKITIFKDKLIDCNRLYVELIK